MALRTLTLTRKAGKRAPVKMIVGTSPDDVDAVDGATSRKHLRMRDRTSGYYLGKDGMFVKNGGHSRRFNPSQARNFLERKRSSNWEVC